MIIVGTYVDDLIIGSSTKADRDAFLDEVAKDFKITQIMGDVVKLVEATALAEA